MRVPFEDVDGSDDAPATRRDLHDRGGIIFSIQGHMKMIVVV
jgi:hypothetical protein